MKYRSCENCLWYGSSQCDDSHVCNSFSPILEDIDDDEVQRLVKEGYKEYKEAYDTYLNTF